MGNPAEILVLAYERASQNIGDPLVKDPEIIQNIRYVCRNPPGAPTRFLLACSLAKVHMPSIDIRKPYTEIAGKGAYSGRVYDETYLDVFIREYRLPCNRTTAFLTPAFRTWTGTIPIEPNTEVRARKHEISTYHAAFQTLTDIHQGNVMAEEVLAETIRQLLLIKTERQLQLETLRSSPAARPLSVEQIVTLIDQHLRLPRSSRLPILIVAAAYKAAEDRLAERVLPLQQHNAADDQTGAMGDIEISLLNDENVITCYEMKKKKITSVDIEDAITKALKKDSLIDNYIFITTESISEEVKEYADSMYEVTGIEVAILDCIGFLRHFLHLFYRLRIQFLDTYQELVLAETYSAVRQELKIALLALRQAAESSE